jgi:hypothetical protein
MSIVAAYNAAFALRKAAARAPHRRTRHRRSAHVLANAFIDTASAIF